MYNRFAQQFGAFAVASGVKVSKAKLQMRLQWSFGWARLTQAACAAVLALIVGVAPALAQKSEKAERTKTLPADEIQIEKIDLAAAVQRAAAHLLLMQERAEGQADTELPSEWPYEGVYRSGGKIPIGYRIGGTAIVVTALVRAPGYGADAKRTAAIAEGVRFICDQTAHPLMSYEDYDAGYDVRGWGYTYGLLCLCELQQQRRVPAGLEKEVARAMKFYAEAIEQTQIPQVGGWNYARPAGKNKPAAPSTFMTPATVQALFAARQCGMAVKSETVAKAIAFMESSMAAEGEDAGSVTYAGPTNTKRPEAIPGFIGRMCVTEATLAMAGKSGEARLTRAVEAFVTHWDELDKRRQRGGTHEGKYGVAPYYFMFAHHAASQAIAMLPGDDGAAVAKRQSLLDRCNALLFRVQAADGSWNDRVFKRSSGYGTAMAVLSISGPATWMWENHADATNKADAKAKPRAKAEPDAKTGTDTEPTVK